ncbi:MAG: type II toxin-antitoxin system HicB family antitoxin [bacterium]
MAKRSKVAEYYVIYERDEDGYFIASCPSIKGCVAAGKTLDEAYQNIKEAIESCLEALEKMERSFPEEKFPHEKIAQMSLVTVGI